MSQALFLTWKQGNIYQKKKTNLYETAIDTG